MLNMSETLWCYLFILTIMHLVNNNFGLSFRNLQSKQQHDHLRWKALMPHSQVKFEFLYLIRGSATCPGENKYVRKLFLQRTKPTYVWEEKEENWKLKTSLERAIAFRLDGFVTWKTKLTSFSTDSMLMESNNTLNTPTFILFVWRNVLQTTALIIAKYWKINQIVMDWMNQIARNATNEHLIFIARPSPIPVFSCKFYRVACCISMFSFCRTRKRIDRQHMSFNLRSMLFIKKNHRK